MKNILITENSDLQSDTNISEIINRLPYLERQSILEKLKKESELWLKLNEATMPAAARNPKAINFVMSEEVCDRWNERHKKMCERYNIDYKFSNSLPVSHLNFESEITEIKFCIKLYNALLASIKDAWKFEKKKVCGVVMTVVTKLRELTKEEHCEFENNEYIQHLINEEKKQRMQYINKIKALVKNFKGEKYDGSKNLWIKDGYIKHCRKDRNWEKAQVIEDYKWNAEYFWDQVEKFLSD